VNQDAAGKPAKRVFVRGLAAELWVRELADGSHAVGLFNRTTQAAKVELNWSDAGLKSTSKVRDLWLRKDLAKGKIFSVEIPSHGCVLLRAE